MGLPDEAAVRCAVLGSALAEEVGATDEERGDAYWLSLLRYAGCTADAHLNAAVLEDEIAVHRDMYGIDYGEPGEFLPFFVRRVGRDKPFPARLLTLLDRVRQDAGVVRHRARALRGRRSARRAIRPRRGHAQGALPRLRALERQGLPFGVKGEAIARAARLAERGAGGRDRPSTRRGERRGCARAAPRGADARSVARRALREGGHTPLRELDGPSMWPAFLAAEPGPPRMIDDAALDEGLRAMARLHRSPVAMVPRSLGRRRRRWLAKRRTASAYAARRPS